MESLKKLLKVSDETFSSWINEVQDGFEEENLWALSKAAEDVDHKVTPRPLIQELQNQSNFCKELMNSQQSLKRDFELVKDNVIKSAKRMKQLEDENAELKEMVKQMKTQISNQFSYVTELIKDLSHNVAAKNDGHALQMPLNENDQTTLTCDDNYKNNNDGESTVQSVL